jgi:hypothetical protein
MSGMRDYFLSKQDYLKSQVGNPEGADKPNKSTSCPLPAKQGTARRTRADPAVCAQSTPTRVSGFARARRP